VPAIAGGVLAEIRVGAGDVAPVGAVVAVIADKAGAVTSREAAKTGAPPRTPAAPASAAVPATSPGAQQRTPPLARPAPLDPFREVRSPERNYGPARLPGGAVITPLARRLASEAGIDLTKVKGSGPHGRIVARDISQPAPQEPPARGALAFAGGLTFAEVKALYQDTPHEEVALDGMRRTIAARLALAKQTIPHFYLTADIELEKLIRLRADANASAGEDKGGPAFKLSLNDFFIKALALALQRVPAANAVWAEDRLLRFKHSDVGVAVALEGGLLTPVIRQAEAKPLRQISAEMNDLAARAQARRLKPQEYQGGATAISNLGMYGVRDFSAIINPPHATVLAVGAAQRRPAEAEDGSVKFVSQMTATLSCDHRIVDGALGAELLAAFRNLLENPLAMLV
jgi:pyruvate dehydrogenase E2 component (dihydrolipoamide acetyltransferase)